MNTVPNIKTASSFPGPGTEGGPANQAREAAANPRAPEPVQGDEHMPRHSRDAGRGSFSRMADRGTPPPASSLAAVAQQSGINNPENMKQLAGELYQQNRWLHGTTKKDLENMRREGMDPRKKTPGQGSTASALRRGLISGTTKQLEEFAKTSLQHNYFTRLKVRHAENLGAEDYATLAARGGAHTLAKLKAFLSSPGSLKEKIGAARNTDRRAILRGYLPSGSVNLEADPHSCGSPNPSVRTNEPVAAGYVLKSKASPPSVTEASEAFRKEFNTSPRRKALKIDTTISSQQAAEMLNEAQTDSATDFSGPPPWGM